MIYIFVGIPSSGKSTESKRIYSESCMRHRSCTILSRDKIRFELAPHAEKKFIGSLHFEERVTGAFNKKLCRALTSLDDIIIDNMNIRPKYIKETLSFVKHFGRLNEVEIKFGIFTDDLNRCIELNKQRPREDQVPEDAIRKCYEKYKSNKDALINLNNQLKEESFIDSIPEVKNIPNFCKFNVEPVIEDNNLAPAYIFDVDGTLAAHNRSPYDYVHCDTDSVIEPTARILRALSKEAIILIMSGRPAIDQNGNDIRYMTHDWLEKNNIPYENLFMREEGDTRNDAIIKYELFNKNVRGKYDIKGVFDDRLRVLTMWEELGVPVYNVNNGMGEY